MYIIVVCRAYLKPTHAVSFVTQTLAICIGKKNNLWRASTACAQPGMIIYQAPEIESHPSILSPVLVSKQEPNHMQIIYSDATEL